MTMQASGMRSNSVPYSREALINDVRRLRDAWDACRNNRQRTAIYNFLSEVLNLVRMWNADCDAKARVRSVYGSQGSDAPQTLEPFGGLIIAAVHPEKLDGRTVSKWSRVLRYAQAAKLASEPLQQFVQRKGGINKCAARYTAEQGRRENRHTMRGRTGRERLRLYR